MTKRRIGWELLLAVLLVVAVVFFFISSSAWMAELALGNVPYSVDESLGKAASAEIELTSKRCQNPAALEYVEALAAPLVSQLAEEGFRFQFVVIDEPSINAFALPGGYVFVHSGLLANAESGEEVAGVIAHELSHVVLRHSVERILRDAGRSILIGIVFGVGDVGVLLQYAGSLRELSYGREQETDADSMGHDLLKSAGISPRGLATFFARLDREGLAPPELLSTHPDSKKRAEAALRAATTFSPTVELPSPTDIPCN